MSFTVTQIKDHLTGLSHGATLNKVRNIESMLERAASKFLLKAHILETIRIAPLTNTVHDDVYNYTLPSDFGILIDLFPQADRQSWDIAYRNHAGKFDLLKAAKNNTLSIEGSEGTKIIRINWRTRSPKVLNTLDSVTSNGTWSAVGTATGIEQDKITKYTGQASVRFDSAASGDGIENTGMTQVDMTDFDEVADIFLWFYIKNSTDLTKLTSATCLWGNDLTTAFWTGVAQTAQFDGTDFKIGWNLIRVPWSTATETGTVDKTKIDAFRITFATTAAITDIRVDNITFSIGKAFDIKYHSKFLFKNSAGTWISITTDDNDSVMIDNDSLPIFLYECLKEMAHQMEGTDSAFDISYADNELRDLYPTYKAINPSNIKKLRGSYGSAPGNRRWGGRSLSR